MQAELWLVNDYRGWRIRLHKSSDQADETKRAIRELTCQERVIAFVLSPHQLNCRFISADSVRLQFKIVEKRNGKLYGL